MPWIPGVLRKAFAAYVLVTPVIRPYDRCHIVLCDNSKACG